MELSQCKKCLVREIPDMEYYKNMYDYINSIEEELKVEALLYEERLSICKECDSLFNGMCRKCGCFVEMRAIMRIKSCPNVPSLW